MNMNLRPACLYLLVVLSLIILGLVGISSRAMAPSPPEYYYQVPNPQWRYLTDFPTPQDYAAANDLADRFFPTKRNTITSTMF